VPFDNLVVVFALKVAIEEGKIRITGEELAK